MPDTPEPTERALGDAAVGPPHDHVIETEVKGTISLYDPKQERVLVLNATASDVWLLCDGTLNVAQIVDLLAKAYEQEPEAIRQDVEETISQFIEEGFIAAP